MKIKLTADVSVHNVTMPTGTVLNFGIESFAVYRGRKIMKSDIPGLESDNEETELLPEGCSEDSDKVAETVVKLLRNRYPNGFSADELAEDIGDTINGCVYSILEDDDKYILKLNTDDGESIEIELEETEGSVFRITDKVLSSEIKEITDGVESFIGRLALAMA